jgi:hypothetical protein
MMMNVCGLILDDLKHTLYLQTLQLDHCHISGLVIEEEV